MKTNFESTNTGNGGSHSQVIQGSFASSTRHLLHNQLLRALPDESRNRIFPHMEFVSLQLGQVLYEPDQTPQYVYFPIDSLVSVVHMMADGHTVEVGLQGSEGMVGVSLFLGGGSGAPQKAVVQYAGRAYRLPSAILMREFDRGGALLSLLLRYTQTLFTQAAQTAVCNRRHSVDQQFCRRLLLSLDRLPTNNLTMTQELIANMLGVRREGVTEAAGRLQAQGLIRYKRGQITVLDRAGLEHASCECYKVMKGESDRLSPDKHCERHADSDRLRVA